MLKWTSNTFKDILELIDGPVTYSDSGRGNLKMSNHPYPYSIKEEEFNFLRNLIVEHNLQRGYECATAFGISSTALGLGFKETGGKIVTMDAYIEESKGNPGHYRDMQREVYDKADGYKSVKYLIEQFGLEDTLFPEIGWSPDDTETCIRRHFSEPLDFVLKILMLSCHYLVRNMCWHSMMCILKVSRKQYITTCLKRLARKLRLNFHIQLVKI